MNMGQQLLKVISDMNPQLWHNIQIIFYLLPNLFMPLIHFNTPFINLDNQIGFVYTFILPHKNQGYCICHPYIYSFVDFQCSAVQP